MLTFLDCIYTDVSSLININIVVRVKKWGS